MAPIKYIGADYVTPDLVAKVMGEAKYAEDFRVEGMLFCKLLLSPLPHARVRRIDLSAALAMPGVRAILTADDLPATKTPLPPAAERPVTNEPHYQGEPVAAVAAVDELAAAEAIEKIKIEWEPLPFVVDPLESLRPGGANARTVGNVWFPSPPGQTPPRPEIKPLKWTEENFADERDGRLPMGEAPEEWHFGDLDAAFKEAALELDETFVVQSTSHQPMEPRSAMAYWRNGKLHLYASTQSVIRTVDNVAGWLAISPDDLVLISEYCGGGFGSKGGGPISMAIPALLARKVNAPVMMRVSREEEHFIGRGRTNMTGRVKVAFRRDGRIAGIDLFIVQDNGSYGSFGDLRSAANAVSVLYQPPAMRWRGVSVFTNTPPRSQQRSPGWMQANGLLESAITKAARQLGIDQVEIRKINSPEGKATYGAPRADGTRPHMTSAFVKAALDRGSELFRWNERKTGSGIVRGTRVRGIGVAVGTHPSGSIGFDGLMTIRPDGRLHVHTGVGNLGTHSVIDLARVAAETLQMPWERVEVVWGDTSKHLPWSPMSVGSQTTHAATRANHAAALDAKRKLLEIAARDLGGAPGEYELGDGRVFRRGNPARSMSYQQAAQRAIALGGEYDGHVLPEEIHPVTRKSASALAGSGLIGVAKDLFPRDGDTFSFIAGFAEVEVDVETGKTTLVDYLAVGDVGTVVNPRSLKCQILGGSCLGIGHALMQRIVYDQRYGAALSRRFHYNKPLSILDTPPELHAEALNIPDPETPVGARGVGEPPVGAGYGAVMNAIADAVGVDVFRRAPVTPDVILMSLEHKRRMHAPLTTHV